MDINQHGTGQPDNVVALLETQHRQIEQLIDRVESAAGAAKLDPFEDLVRMLAVHEAAEEEVVHPAASHAHVGEEVVQKRLSEENEAKHALSNLYELGVEHADFDAKFREFAQKVVQHAQREENDEFVRLAERCDAKELSRLATLVTAAEAVAPTRPHPGGGESAAANLLAGPPLAVFDRVRDMVRDWRQKIGS